MGLGALESMEIAAKLQKAEIKEMPKFLSDEDEEAVKRSLSFLRASSHAIKTWAAKEAYLTAREETLRAAAAREVAYADALRKAGLAGSKAAALKRSEKKLALLQAESKRINASSAARRYADLEARLEKTKARFTTYIWKRVDEGDSRWTIKTIQQAEGAMRFIQGKEGKEIPGLSFLALDPQGRALLKSYGERVKNLTAEIRKLGYEPSMAVDARIIENQKAREAAIGAHRKAVETRIRHEHLQQVTATALEQAKLAGEFYIISALGDALEELASNLAYNS